MRYSGMCCRIKTSSELIFYRSKNLFSLLSKVNRFNDRVELPANVIMGYEIKSFFGVSVGLSLRIQSERDPSRIKKLRPINIAFLPSQIKQHLLNEIDAYVNCNDSRFQQQLLVNFA